MFFYITIFSMRNTCMHRCNPFFRSVQIKFFFLVLPPPPHCRLYSVVRLVSVISRILLQFLEKVKIRRGQVSCFYPLFVQSMWVLAHCHGGENNAVRRVHFWACLKLKHIMRNWLSLTSRKSVWTMLHEHLRNLW